MSVLVTGANGFIGAHLMRSLDDLGLSAMGAVRKAPNGADFSPVTVGDVDGKTDWTYALRGRSTVVHTAGAAHASVSTPSELAILWKVNVDGVERLAEQAAAAGVRRFIYLSTAKVHGDRTDPGNSFSADSPLRPTEPYAESKAAAEQRLWPIGERTGMEIVVVRPVLVYGPGVRANFQALMRLVTSRVPLPLASVNNRRSYVSVFNLCSFVVACVHAEQLSGAFLVSDGVDLSTPALLTKIAAALGVRARLFRMPIGVLTRGSTLLGRQAVADRLLGSLTVDADPARRALCWSPPVNVERGLHLTAQAYRTTDR